MPVTETLALDLADALRRGRGIAYPFDLWRAANVEAAGVRIARIERFRHAMIHAGYILTVKGNAYKRCPMCHETLRR